MNTHQASVGTLLRDWRQRRRMSQLELALVAEISARHLSFVETGRSQPSRDMVMRLSRHLAIPPREQNTLLVAAGFAPVFPERPLDSPELAPAREAVDLILAGHEPVPALAIDRRWNLVAANGAVPALIAGVDPALLGPPVNVVRLSLHPDGLAPRIRNLAQWRNHMIRRLERDVDLSGASEVMSLLEEIYRYPAVERVRTEASSPAPVSADVAIPLQLEVGDDVLVFLSTTTVFGTPIDITLSELAIESFFPANEETAAFLRRMTDQ